MNRFWKILEENWKDNENFLNYLLLGFYWNFFFFLSSETEKKEGNFEATSSCVCVFGLEDKKGYWICCCCYSKIKSWLADIGWLAGTLVLLLLKNIFASKNFIIMIRLNVSRISGCSHVSDPSNNTKGYTYNVDILWNIFFIFAENFEGFV